MIERKKYAKGKIGIFAVAHATYWDQFEGLLDNIMGYHADLCDKIKEKNCEVFDFGMIDSSEKAFDIVKEIQSADVDVVSGATITSTAILEAVQEILDQAQ